MKKFLLLFSIALILTLAVITVSAADCKIWDFTQESTMAEWQPSETLAYAVTAKGTTFQPKANEENNMNMSYKIDVGGEINLDDYAILIVEYVDADVGGTMQFYHWTEGGEGNPRVDIEIKTSPTLNQYKVNMRTNAPETAKWSGKISRIRFDPLRGSGERKVTVKMMGLFKDEKAYKTYIGKSSPELANQPGYVAEPGGADTSFGKSASNCTIDIDYASGYTILTSLNGPDTDPEGKGDCYVVDTSDFDGDEYQWIKMRIRNLSKAENFEFHFASAATESKITASSCTHFPITSEDSDFKEYVFNVKDYNLKSQAVNKDVKLDSSVWTGNISSVRFDCMWIAEPSGQMPTGSQMYIDYIAFLPTEESAKAYQPIAKTENIINSGKPSPIWYFHTQEDIDRWSISQLNASMELGMAKFNPTGSDPTMSYSFSEKDMFDTQEFKYLAIRCNIKSKVTVGGLFFTTSNLTSLSDESYSQFNINNQGVWSNILVDLTTYPKGNWTGTCDSIRLDPINGNDTEADVLIERMGFFRSKEEASTFLSEAKEELDYTQGAIFYGKLQKSIVPGGSLYEGFNKADFLLLSTAPEGTLTAELPIIYYTDKEGKSNVVALGYTNAAGYSTFVANKAGKYTLGYNHKDYADTNGHWGIDYINFVSDRKLFGGTSETEFSPELTMTRGMFITVLGRMHGVDASMYNGETGYGDVSAKEYYAPYIQWARAFSIMDGLSSVTFAPEDPISRETMAVVISNYIKAYSYKFISMNDVTEFTDLAGCDAGTAEAIKSAQNAGIINGKGNGIFDPKGISTRAEVAAVMQRVIKSVLGVNIVSTENTSEYISRKRIRLGVWGFAASQAKQKGMDYLRELGMDLIVTGGASTSANKNFLFNYADKNAIEIFVNDFPTSKVTAESYDYVAHTAAYSEHPSFSGNYITDEPGTEDYPWLGKISNDYMKALPGKIPFTNLLPMYANAAQLKYGAGAAAIEYYDSDPDLFRNYCVEWFKNFDCNYICTDIYPLNWSGKQKTTYKDYIESINQIAAVARENNKEFWCCIQTFAWTGSKRTPNEEEYRWQCYSMLSFGCTGILLWTYMNSGNYQSIINTATLEPTQAYYDCKPVIWEMRAISDIFVQYKNLGAFTHNYSSTVPYLRMTNEYKNFQTIKEINCPEPLLIGCFEKEDKSGTAFTLVNMAEFSSEKGTTVKFKTSDTSKTVTAYYRGKPVVLTLSGGYYSINLECGDGVFVTVG